MMIERNENKKEAAISQTKTLNSPLKVPKPSKENVLHPTLKDCPPKVSKNNITETNSITTDLATIETNKISNDYLKKILTNELSKTPENFRTDFLLRHKFGSEIRARMVN